MKRTTTGHPLRALRGAGVLLLLWAAYRVPAIRADFVAAVAATGSNAAVVQRIPEYDRLAVRLVASTLPTGPRRSSRSRSSRSRAGTIHRTVVEERLPVIDDPVLATVIAPDRQPPAVPAMPGPTASDDATNAYARLAAGDRRAAVRLFDAALAAGPDPRAAVWRRQRDMLTRRWSANAYSILRGHGAIDLAATPVLGGGQSGAALAWTPDPLAARPLALTVRAAAAHDDRGRSAFAAVGVAWYPFAGVTLAAERLVAIGPAARGDWTARIAGGVARSTGALDVSAYGEGGAVGSAVYAAAQAHLGATLRHGRSAFGPGVGAWASVQRGGGATVDRLDLGPGVTARAGALTLSADYRFRVAGNAAPGSGPVVTLSAVL